MFVKSNGIKMVKWLAGTHGMFFTEEVIITALLD